MMRVFSFVDLDDTLFQTRRKCFQTKDIIPAALDKNGLPLSFMTEKQYAFFEWLCANSFVIPTTARNYSAFRRVLLNWNGNSIIDYGGCILLENGEQDPLWHERISRDLKPFEDKMQNVLENIKSMASRERLMVRSKIVSDFGLDMYLVAKNRNPDKDNLRPIFDYLIEECVDRDFRIFLSDNNLSVIPSLLDKKNAVDYLIETKIKPEGDNFISIGIGDSLSDVSFLSTLDYAMTPRQSQIMNLLRREGHV